VERVRMGEMVTDILHELNQTLAAITNYAQASARLLAADSADLT
jgi:C4-dicarboxylate-specific signal transduction histidine kinase